MSLTTIEQLKKLQLSNSINVTIATYGGESNIPANARDSYWSQIHQIRYLVEKEKQPDVAAVKDK